MWFHYKQSLNQIDTIFKIKADRKISEIENLPGNLSILYRKIILNIEK